MSKLGETNVTGRGFGTVVFKDKYNETCSLQCSSAIGDYDDSFERPGTSYVWLGIDEPKPIIMASDARACGMIDDNRTGWVDVPLPEGTFLSSRMHLDREQVAGLIERLQHWLDNGTFE